MSRKEIKWFFCVRVDAGVWAYWNLSFNIHVSYLGPISCVFPSWVSSGLIVGSSCSLMTARWQVFFSFLNYPRVHQLTSSLPAVAAITDDSEILCLLTWQATFHFSSGFHSRCVLALLPSSCFILGKTLHIHFQPESYLGNGNNTTTVEEMWVREMETKSAL